MFRALSFIITICVVLGASSSANAATKRTQSLEGWLTTTVTPKLANTLSSHPKFRGEVIRMSAMQDGHIIPHSNKLISNIERDLTHLLNRYQNIRIQWRGQPSKPSDRPIHYVLGIEVQPHGTYEHRVTLAMVDLSEGIWVSGTAARWQGRLSRSEKAAYATVTHHKATPTTTLAPLTYQSVKRSGVCEGRADTRCVEVQVKLNLPAQLLVFTTANGKLSTACSATTDRAAGTYLFRLAVRQQPDQRADMGLYALATHDKDLAKQLRQLIDDAAPGCGHEGNTDWQETLSHMLAARAASVDWQALHLERTDRGVRAL